jgi:hypothetical protein
MKYEPPSGSTTLVTPLSCAMICCVRSASVAASSVERVGVQRVGAAEHGRQRLQRRADHVVAGLLGGE